MTLGGNRQPGAPITLAFDLSNEPDLYKRFTDSVHPVVAANSDDRSKSDLLEAKWDPTTKTVTATTDHLSVFNVVAVDVGSVLTGAATKLTAATSTGAPPCPKGADATALTVTPSKAGVVDACARAAGTGMDVDLKSHSAQYYTVTSKPPGTLGTSQPVGGTDQLAVQLDASMNGGKSRLLTPQGSSTLTVPGPQTSATVDLDVNPVALQLETILTGISMLGIEGDDLVDAFDHSKSLYDCVATAYKDWQNPVAGNTIELTTMLGDIAQCGLAGAKAAVGDSENKLLHKMSVATSLLTTLPHQLAANVTGILGELNGANHVEFTVAAGNSTSAAAPSTAQAAVAAAPHGPGWFDLKDIQWNSSGNGFDCCRTLTIGTTKYPNSILGWYTTGPRYGDPDKASIMLGGLCTKFVVDVGQSADSGNPQGPGQFRVWTDDTKLIADETIGLDQPAVHLDLDVTGASRLKIQDERHEPGANNVWGSPRLYCSENPKPKN